MKRYLFSAAILLFAVSIAQGEPMERINLPEPKTRGSMSVEESIQKRRSVRSYASKDISPEDLSQLLWACQGITDSARGLRAAPSAGALYPLEIYVVKAEGLYLYNPDGHILNKISGKDLRGELAAGAYGQNFVSQVPVDIVIAAVYGRITSKYGERGIMYTHMEAGHAAENVCLQAVALGLDTVLVGAFSDSEVSRTLNLPRDVKPLYILPVGYRRQ